MIPFGGDTADHIEFQVAEHWRGYRKLAEPWKRGRRQAGGPR
jgi:hypothetical protein